MREIILCVCLLFLIKAIGQEKIEKAVFVPDTSINEILCLLNKESIIKTIGNQKGKLINDEKPSRVQLKNKNGTQYLILYHLNGANANTFNLFEIGFLSKNHEKYIMTNFKYFFSLENIKLGISKKVLIKMKGDNYIKENFKNIEIIKYEIKGDDNSFLKKYNMPIYISEYYFKNERLNKIIFGFPNL